METSEYGESFRGVSMKELIVQESIKLINKNGLSFSLDSLAKNLGISKKTIYKHVRNKEEIIREIIRDAFAYTKKKQAEILISDISVLEKIKGLMTIAPEDQEIFNSTNMHALRVHYKELYQETDDLFNVDWEITFELIDEAKELGLLKDFDNQLFRHLYIQGIFFEYDGDITYQKRLDSIVSLLFEGVKK